MKKKRGPNKGTPAFGNKPEENSQKEKRNTGRIWYTRSQDPKKLF
jgi:hypothetical protein